MNVKVQTHCFAHITQGFLHSNHHVDLCNIRNNMQPVSPEFPSSFHQLPGVYNKRCFVGGQHVAFLLLLEKDLLGLGEMGFQYHLLILSSKRERDRSGQQLWWQRPADALLHMWLYVGPEYRLHWVFHCHNITLSMLLSSCRRIWCIANPLLYWCRNPLPPPPSFSCPLRFM